MQFLRENKWIVLLLLSLPLFFLKLDAEVVNWLRYHHQNRTALFDAWRLVAPLIKFLGHGTTIFVAGVLLYIAGRYLNNLLSITGRTLLVGFLTSGIIVQILKHLIGRARPRITDELLFAGPSLRGGYDSFPSGHTAVAFCLAVLLSHHIRGYRHIFYLLALIVGFERIVDISHFPSDVIGGVIVGLLVGRVLVMKAEGFTDRTAYL